ncbi:hypothetical protein LTR10_021400 [Elasticomyces elasticus]|nr:hypothetical protein LTR10_021400 [Elasticomyces elasticus]KAK4971788.1 hypothetical protein LTR42_007516 [Elasticomyces elasticus]
MSTTSTITVAASPPLALHFCSDKLAPPALEVQSDTIIDPLSVDHHVQPTWPLSADSLEDVFAYKASHDGIVAAQNGIVAARDLQAGSHLAYLTSQTPSENTWATLMTSKTTFVDVNSAFLYVNHGCTPNLTLVIFAPDANGSYPQGRSGEVRVRSDRNIAKGEELTWFYPQTEWVSARPFQCQCGAASDICVGLQRGSKYLTRSQLEGHELAPHVLALLDERGDCIVE